MSLKRNSPSAPPTLLKTVKLLKTSILITVILPVKFTTLFSGIIVTAIFVQMPVEVFATAEGDEYSRQPYHLGIIPITPEVVTQLTEALLLTPSAELVAIDHAIIRRRAAATGIPDFAAKPPRELLDTIETEYLFQAAALFDVQIQPDIPASNHWAQIMAVYTHQKTTLQAEALRKEDLRMQTARALQLNKLLATWDEINAELDELGIKEYCHG